MPGIGAFVIVVLALVASAFKVVREYERLVVFRLGRLVGPRGPGLTLVIPGIEKAVRVDLRTVTMDVPAQDVITKDNVSVKVNAVLYFRVDRSRTARWSRSRTTCSRTSQNAQTTLRSVCGEVELDELLGRAREDQRAAADDHRPAHRAVGHQGRAGGDQAHRPAGGDAARDGAAGRGGARAARQGDRRGGRVPGGAAARARRRRSWRSEPITLQLRYLQTLAEIATENNSTTIFPVPMDLLRPLLERAAQGRRRRREDRRPRLRAAGRS